MICTRRLTHFAPTGRHSKRASKRRLSRHFSLLGIGWSPGLRGGPWPVGGFAREDLFLPVGVLRARAFGGGHLELGAVSATVVRPLQIQILAKHIKFCYTTYSLTPETALTWGARLAPRTAQRRATLA